VASALLETKTYTDFQNLRKTFPIIPKFGIKNTDKNAAEILSFAKIEKRNLTNIFSINQ